MKNTGIDNSVRVYLDLEYMYSGMTEKSGRPTSKDLRQIVQIGAILFDNERNQELDNLSILTFPTFNKELPAFFVDLTNITQADLSMYGISFTDGLKRFFDFTNQHPIWTFDLDQEVLEQNCRYVNIHFPFQNDFIRVKPNLSKWNIDPDHYSSGTLYQAVGLKLKGHVHDALHDVRSMARAVHILEQK